MYATTRNDLETFRAVAITLIGAQFFIAALLTMPFAPPVSVRTLLVLLFIDFVVLVALFQFPVPTTLRFGIIAGMTVLLLVVAAKSDPLGLRAVKEEVKASAESSAAGQYAPGTMLDIGGAGAVGARLTIQGQGVDPLDTYLGGPAASGFSIRMRVLEDGESSVVLDWSISSDATVKRCGRLTVFVADPALLLPHIEPPLSRSIQRSIAAGKPSCH